MRYFLLLGLAAFVIIAAVYLVGSALDRRRTQRAMQYALSTERRRRNNVWKEVESVGDMVGLYMMMVAKHGPDSEEAKAFRFGTDSQLMKELHGDSEARTAFEQQADIIDETWRATRRVRV
jgi:hypothetical protein